MATKPKETAQDSKPSGPNNKVNMEQHGFSGATCEIKLFKAEPGEPTQPFFAINSYTVQLQRDVWVEVPVELADYIESLAYDELTPDPSFPDDRTKDTWQAKPRFPMQRKG